MKISQKSNYYLEIGLAIFAALIYAIPLEFLILTGGSHLPFSNESIAFRYFTALRILSGEGGTVWTAQGQFTSLIQLLIFWASEKVNGAGLTKENLDIFSILSTAATNLFMLIIYLKVARDQFLTFSDKACIFFLGPTILFATVHAGFYYFLLPDYLAFSMVIISLSAYLTIHIYRKDNKFTWNHLLILSFISGLAASNKITLLGISSIPVLLMILKKPLDIKIIFIRIIFSGFITVSAFVLIFYFLYLLNINATLIALMNAAGFFKSIGGETGFWAQNFKLFQTTYGYDKIFYFWLVCTIFMAVELCRRREFRGLPILASCIFTALLLGLGLYKRGAGTTFFELSCILGGLTSIAISVAIGSTTKNIFIKLIPVLIFTISIFKFDYVHNWIVVNRSVELSGTSWEVFDYLTSLKRPVQVIIINGMGEYETSGVIDLSKGLRLLNTNEFSNDYPLVNKVFPNIEFLTQPKVFESGTAVMWVERWDPILNAPLKISDQSELDHLNILNEIANKNKCREWLTGYSNQQKIHACIIDNL